HVQSPCAKLRLHPQCDRSRRVPVYFSAGSPVLRWAVEVSKGVLGLWYLRGADLYLQRDLPNRWKRKRTAGGFLALYVDSLLSFRFVLKSWHLFLQSGCF